MTRFSRFVPLFLILFAATGAPRAQEAASNATPNTASNTEAGDAAQAPPSAPVAISEKPQMANVDFSDMDPQDPFVRGLKRLDEKLRLQRDAEEAARRALKLQEEAKKAARGSQTARRVGSPRCRC